MAHRKVNVLQTAVCLSLDFILCICVWILSWKLPQRRSSSRQAVRVWSVWWLYLPDGPSVTSLTAHCLCLFAARQRNHPAVQPAAWGIRQRQDCEEQQLQQICKAFVFQLAFSLSMNLGTWCFPTGSSHPKKHTSQFKFSGKNWWETDRSD